MKRAPLLFVCLAFAPLAAFGTIQNENELITQTDPSYQDTVNQFDDLRGASLIQLRHGIPQKVLFTTATEEQLAKVAESLLRRVDAPGDSSLMEDPDRAKLMATKQARNAYVWQHFVDGTIVLNSIVVARIFHDGQAEVINALIPTARSQKAELSPAQALAAADHSKIMRDWLAGGSAVLDSKSERYFALGPSGKAEPAYKFAVKNSTRVSDVYIGSIDGQPLGLVASHDDIDTSPDDGSWQLPPIVYYGQHPTQNLINECTLLPTPEPTDYYHDVNPLLWLNAGQVQLNIGGPAERLRNPSLGLTAIHWPDSFSAFDQRLPFPISEIVPRIFRNTLCDYPPFVFPPPLNYGGDVPYTREQIWMYRELQTAIQDIELRFGWSGLHDVFGRLVLALGMPDSPSLCAYRAKGFAAFDDAYIYCATDLENLAKGLPERIPPIELFAHEFGHGMLRDLGLVAQTSYEHWALAEGLSDLIGISVKSFHRPISWKLAEEQEYMELYSERLCDIDSIYCGNPPLAAIRDLENPKTNDVLDPSPNYYNGTFFSLTPEHIHQAGQVVSYMMYLLSEGSTGGTRDDDVSKGIYGPFYGVGFQEMLEIFKRSFTELVDTASSITPMEGFADDISFSATALCGDYSNEQFAANQAAWVVNLYPVPADYSKTGYFHPSLDQKDVFPIVPLKIIGTPGKSYDYQVSPDAYFKDIAHTGTQLLSTDLANLAVLKLKPSTVYWWRVREANAPMLQSSWIDKDSACWRPAGTFTTGNAPTVDVIHPLAGETLDPWSARLSWKAGSFDEFEYWVMDADSEKADGLFWAHRVVAAKDLPGFGDAADPAQAILHLPPVPLPQSSELCWEIVGRVKAPGGAMVEGELTQHCFHTDEAQTVITYPVPPSADGKLSDAAGQPLTIDYDPADGADHHEFSLEATKLSGGSSPPDPVGQWAYLDDVSTDQGNLVKEQDIFSADKDWSIRTRERMLPVELTASPYLTHGLDIVQLKIVSFSPTIPSANSGGTHPPRVEQAKPAVVDFHPTSSVSLLPTIVIPPFVQTCSSSQDTSLKVRWQQALTASPQLVPTYHLDLYPEKCGNQAPAGCHPLVPASDPSFAASLAYAKDVVNDGNASLDYEFSRAELFPDEASEHNGVTGFLVHLYGTSGPEPGPAGLNITGEFLVDLPVLPAIWDSQAFYSPGTPDHPEWASFTIGSIAAKNPAHQAGAWHDYHGSESDVVVHEGADCSGAIVSSGGNGVVLAADFPDSTVPTVSGKVALDWTFMNCPKLVSACRSAQGNNPNATPNPPINLTPHEQPGWLGVSWDAPSAQETPATIEYHVMVQYSPSSPLAIQPSPITLPRNATDNIDGQIGVAALAQLSAADAGKGVNLAVQACRQGTNKCSSQVVVPYQIGSSVDNGNGTPPNPPEDVAIHFDDPVAEQTFEEAFGADFDGLALWSTVSWNPPSSGPPPSYYLTTFGSNSALPGVLPTWLNTLNVASANYPQAPSTYLGVVRASPAGLTLGMTSWNAEYVFPLVETYLSGPIPSGVGMTATVRACSGAVPLPPWSAFNWLVGVDDTHCSAPVAVSVLSP
jgi:hypothetical protein